MVGSMFQIYLNFETWDSTAETMLQIQLNFETCGSIV